MTSWLSNNSVTQGIILGHGKGLHEMVLEFPLGEPTTDIHDLHGVTVLTANLDAGTGHADGLLEGGRTIGSGPTMEMHSG